MNRCFTGNGYYIIRKRILKLLDKKKLRRYTLLSRKTMFVKIQEEKKNMPFPDYYLWAGAALLILELVHFQGQRKLHDQRTKLFYGMMCVSLVICIGGIVLTRELSQNMAGAWQARAAAHMVYRAQFGLPFMLFKMVWLTAGAQESGFWKTGAALCRMGSVAILVNPWTKWISWPGADGLLHVGSGYSFFVWGMMALYLVDLLFLFWKRKQMKQQQAAALAEAISLMILGILLQNVFRVFLAVGFAAALMLAVLYLTMQNPYAYVDFVTHVLNTDYFQYWINEKLRQKEELFLLCLKLTDLERIRMEYGTDQELSRMVAEKFWNITPGHAVFRVGYDKYILMTKKESEHRALAESVKELFSKEMAVQNRSMRCPVVMAAIEHAENICSGNSDEIMNYLRFLLQHAEKSREVQCISCSREQQEKYMYERKVEQYIQMALDEDLFDVWYQMVYSIPEKRFVSMEALSRLHHPELGWISPELFIRLTMKNDQIFELMPRQLHKICRFLKENEKALGGIQNVKMNLSPEELTRKGYCENLIAIIRSYGIPPERFQFEITETDATEYSKELEECIQILQNAGISLCLDDFGSGYANLASILKLPFSIIKMDRSLLLDITKNEKSAAFYQSMVETLHHIGYQIVSEGVETRQEAEMLEKWKVDMIQGYYYAPPLPDQGILEKIASAAGTFK